VARLRYLQGEAATRSAGALKNTVHGIRATYLTDPEVVAALLPRPLEAIERPEIFVQFVHVAMHITDDITQEIGALTTGVKCTYEGVPGAYCFHMAMEGESVVTSGRERFGEPKKIAQTKFSREGNKVTATCTRHGVAYFEISGEIGAEVDEPLQFEEYIYCYKGMPAIDREGEFDGDVFLTRLNWKRNYTRRCTMNGNIVLRESAYDPMADIPVRRITSMQYVEGGSQTGGQILRAVPGEWIAPHWVGRYDTPQNVGLELKAAEKVA
jgi:acetoacetate decarboxylase